MSLKFPWMSPNTRQGVLSRNRGGSSFMISATILHRFTRACPKARPCLFGTRSSFLPRQGELGLDSTQLHLLGSLVWESARKHTMSRASFSESRLEFSPLRTFMDCTEPILQS